MKKEGNPFFNEYDVYHDESQVAGYWHGILFIPRQSRQQLINLLNEIRSNTERQDPISLKSLDKVSGPVHRCISAWIHVAVACLIQDFKRKRYEVPTGRRGQWADYRELTQLVKARFVLFRVKDLGTLNLCRDHASKVETTFRMAFKGGLTMFSEHEGICIRSLHFDGHEHYQRRIDVSRILRNVGNPPKGIHLHDDIVVNDDSSDHREPNCQPYDDCQLLQLTDLLVSGFRTVLGEVTNEPHRQVCEPLRTLAGRWNRGRRGFQNSRWYRGFCISEGKIENGEWQFGPVESNLDDRQMKLFPFKKVNS